MNNYSINIEQAKKIYHQDLKEFSNLRKRKNLEKRDFHAFCIGTPKSGTHSVANIFQEYNVKHEPNNIFMIQLIQKIHNKQISYKEVQDILKNRDLLNNLEMDSSHYNGFLIQNIYELFPNAKYIFTIRDCISWLNSWFNHQLSNPTLKYNLIKDVGRNIYYDRGHSYTKYDIFLKEYKLFPIKSYLEFWNEHNKKIIKIIPPNKLLIVETNNISNSIPAIANFLDINKNKISSYNSHEGKTKSNFNILKQIDIEYLTDIATETCNDLNTKYFQIETIKDTLNQIRKDS